MKLTDVRCFEKMLNSSASDLRNVTKSSRNSALIAYLCHVKLRWLTHGKQEDWRLRGGYLQPCQMPHVTSNSAHPIRFGADGMGSSSGLIRMVVFAPPNSKTFPGAHSIPNSTTGITGCRRFQILIRLEKDKIKHRENEPLHHDKRDHNVTTRGGHRIHHFSWKEMRPWRAPNEPIPHLKHRGKIMKNDL